MKGVVFIITWCLLAVNGYTFDSVHNCSIAMAGRNNERVAVATSGGTLAVLDRDGEKLWRADIETDGALRPPLQGSRDGELVVTGFRTLTAFNAASGQIKWVNKNIKTQVTSIEAIESGFLCFLRKGIVTLVDSEGHTRWQTVTGVDHCPATAITGTHVAATGMDREVIGISLTTGEVCWTVKDRGRWPRAVFALADSRYLVVSGTGLVSTIGQDGKLESERELFERERVDFHRIIRVGSETFVGQASDGMLYWFDTNARVFQELRHERPGVLGPLSTGSNRIAMITPGFEVAWIDSKAQLVATTRIPIQGSAAMRLENDWIAVANPFGIHFFHWPDVSPTPER